MPDQHGLSKRDHLTLVQEQTGENFTEPEADLPPWILYLWDWFWDIRPPNPEPLSWQELAAWASLHCNLEPWQITLIRQMDKAFCQTVTRLQKDGGN